MKRITMILVTGMAMSCLMLSCDRSATQDGNSNTISEIQKDFDKEKAELSKNLQGMRDEIDQEIDAISDRLETADKKSRAKLEEFQRDLTEQRNRIDQALDDINDSTKESWDNLKNSLKKTGTEIKEEWRDLREKISESLDKV